MASILPQCSWCGGDLKENELRNSKEEILEQWEKKKNEIEYQKKIKQHGEDVKKSFEESGYFSLSTMCAGSRQWSARIFGEIHTSIIENTLSIRLVKCLPL